MKRKTTQLEKRLLDNGYYLSHKSYSGRKSEKTLSYTYVCQNKFVRLDYKREKVITYGLLNYHAMELGEMELQGISLALSKVKNDIDYCNGWRKITPSWFFDRNANGVPPSEMNEQEELGAMTPEDFDELCQEHEQDKEQEIIDHIKGYEGD